MRYQEIGGAGSSAVAVNLICSGEMVGKVRSAVVIKDIVDMIKSELTDTVVNA